MIKSTKNSLSTILLGFFNQHRTTSFSYEELCSELGVTNKSKQALKETLKHFITEGILSKKGHRYYLENKDHDRSSPTPSIANNPKLIEGIFDATPLARNYSYAFVRTTGGDYFCGSEDTLNAYHNDVVAIEEVRKGRTRSCIIRKILKRANQQLAGDLVDSGGRILFVCSNPKIHNWFDVSDLAQARIGDKVILEVSNWGNPLNSKVPVGKVVEILGPSGDPQVELLAVIRQYGLPLDFPHEVITEAETIEIDPRPEDYRNRADFRDIYTFTIDPASAKDFDDAISIRTSESGWTLWVHIADVAKYVGIGSNLFSEAAVRGNSFYFPKKVIPMLPERISNRICSLRPDEEKLTISVVTEFNRKGKVASQRLVESVIRSNRRLSYEEVDSYFEGREQDFDNELRECLNSARELSGLLTKHRLASGYIFFDLPEIEFEYDNEGFVRRLNLAEETESHKLIENFMLVANEYVAEQLTKKAPCTIYRIHENPDPGKLDKLAETLHHYGLSLFQYDDVNRSLQALINSMPSQEYHAVFDRMILRSMKKAVYSTDHIRHFGLGMETYTHFTSPIRRLCDLVIHHLCKMYILKSESPALSKKQVSHFAQISSEQELQADAAERDIDRIYSNTYMRKRIGEHFNGMVIGANSNGLIVRLTEIPVSAILKPAYLHKYPWQYLDRQMRYVNKSTGDYYQLMDKVKVTVIDVSDDIYLDLTDDDNAHTHVNLPGMRPKTRIAGRGTHSKNMPQKRIGIDANSHPKKGGTIKGRNNRKRTR
jgi:ribonuclease R